LSLVGAATNNFVMEEKIKAARYAARSKIPAAPIPPPMHIVTIA
jgi:hypothetical protein